MEMLWRLSTLRQFLEEYVLPDPLVPLLCLISESFEVKHEPGLYYVVLLLSFCLFPSLL